LLKLQYALVNKVVLSKIKERVCPSLRYMPSGGAGVSLPVLHFFEDINIPICEGYGLTETSPVVTSGNNTWAMRRLGCVGVPVDNVIVKILDPETLEEKKGEEDGEICVSGPSVMTGYRNNVKANEEVFFYKDGMKFFRSGDLGRMVEGKVSARVRVRVRVRVSHLTCHNLFLTLIVNPTPTLTLTLTLTLTVS
jgi:long-chain acyl-CoA synthetase